LSISFGSVPYDSSNLPLIFPKEAKAKVYKTLRFVLNNVTPSIGRIALN